MTFGLGYRPDKASRRRLQKNSRAMLGDTPPFPSRATLGAYEAPVYDQGPTGSCTGHGTAQLVYTAMGAANKTLPWVISPGGIYTPVRAIERALSSPGGPLPPLTDSGAMPSDLVVALSRYGVRALPDKDVRDEMPDLDGRFSDVTSTNVNDEPNLLELEESGLTLVTGEYRVDETAVGFQNQMAAAIGDKRAPVGIGVFVDTSFMQWNPLLAGPLDMVDLADPNGGGHWLAVTYYYVGDGGALVFGGPNSWGTLWPLGGHVLGTSPYHSAGHFEVTENFLRKAMSDCYIFAVA